MKQILTYELKKAIHNTKQTIITIVCFVLCLTVLYFIAYNLSRQYGEKVTEEQKQTEIDRYSQEINWYLEMFPSFSDKNIDLHTLPYSVKNDYVNYLYLCYKVETKTIDSDYFQIEGVNNGGFVGYEGSNRTINIGRYGFIFIVISALVVYSLYFSDDADSGRMKNLLASGLSRRKIFAEKLIFSLFLLFLVAMGVYVLGLSCFVGGKNVFTYNYGFTVQSIFEIFTLKMLLNYLAAVFVFSLACLFSQIVKKSGRTVFYTLLTLGAELLLSFVLAGGSFSGAYDELKYFPLLNVFMYEVVLNAEALIPTLVFLPVASTVMLCFATIEFEKRDMA